ncbi:SUMO-1-like protein, partial [Rhizophagus irregularis]
MASNDQLLLQFIKTEAVDSNESTDSFINLKVQDYVKSEFIYKVKKTKPLNKLKQVHCDRNGLNIEIMRFLFDGKRIKDNDTPDSLEMENN